ncbi:MAG: hypothetical protein HOC74_21505, partial [Gemmatimonadetes bacterium]|nr:hypothetical protein [Gemmatimonadota bacterium]
LTGDAFARGPDPLGVWRIIAKTGAQMVLGNHDDRLLRQFRDLRDGREPKIKKADHQFTFDQLRPVADRFLLWLEQLPLYIAAEAFLLVHAGINPATGLARTTRDEFLVIRTWPPIGGTVGPRWHDAYRPDDRLLIFGHDAPGGLVLKKHPSGHLYLIGLDTGCVYGNQLTAYVLEEDNLVQIPCRRRNGYYGKFR